MSLPRRVALAGVAAVGTAGFAGCTRVANLLYTFEDLTVGNYEDSKLEVSLDVEGPHGELVFSESMTLEAGDWETWGDVWERTGEHTVTVRCWYYEEADDDHPPDVARTGPGIEETVTLEETDATVGASVSDRYAFVYRPGDLVVANDDDDPVELDVTVTDPAGDQRLDETIEIDPESLRRIEGVWTESGEYDIEVEVHGGRDDHHIAEVDGSDDALALVARGWFTRLEWGEVERL